MSSRKLKKQIILKDLKENRSYLNLNVSKLVIPFPNEHKIKFLYDGTETIPFKERDPLYQLILIEEFVN